MSRLVSIRFYRKIAEARKDKRLLEKNGINGFIANEHLVQPDWQLSQTVGGVQLQVFDVDMEDAMNVLSERNHDDVRYVDKTTAEDDEKPPVCTRCGSGRIFQIEKLGGIFRISRSIFGFPKETSTLYYCYHCDGDFIC
ncbi:DUF2007 domain-containing protein [Chryseobacterium sp. CBSDS_008]|uniref:DUF2007 domain-containing protein n=1 Tax=Chryseobacterium sp. CBSDS_008 TaxID=3415265 RepID=UPI003CF6B8BB